MSGRFDLERHAEEERMAETRPTYWEIVLEYLHEGYDGWQRGSTGAAARVEKKLGLRPVEGSHFRRELERLGLIEDMRMQGTQGREVAPFHLLPKGIAFMDGSPALDSLLDAPIRALEKAAPSPEAGASAKRGWRTIVTEWVLSKGLDVAWDNRQQLWSLLRSRYPWLPELPL